VTIARALTNTFSGIAPAHVPAFIAAQLFGAFIATLLAGWLFPWPAPYKKHESQSAADVERHDDPSYPHRPSDCRDKEKCPALPPIGNDARNFA
jgi:glycerol uptake facilitator-like aquaporin